MTRDRPIYRPIFGFYRYIGIGQNGDIIGLNRSWQNAVIFLTHPNNLCKKAQRSKSRHLSYNNASRCDVINKQTRLTMEHASAVAAKTKASSGSFTMLEATTCRCCVRINSRYTSRSFRSTKIFQTVILFETNKFHHGEPPLQRGARGNCLRCPRLIRP